MIGEITGKVWGTTQLLFDLNNVEIHRIMVKPGGYCSKHRHTKKFNMFYVEQGTLIVKIWKNAYALVDETSLVPTQFTIVPPGEYHKFEIPFSQTMPTIAYEIYWVSLEKDDIEREDHGGSELPIRPDLLKLARQNPPAIIANMLIEGMK